MANTASATHMARHPNAHHVIAHIPKMKNGSMRVSMFICASLAGAALASVVPTMFQTGVPL